VLWGYFDGSKDEVRGRCITLAGIVSSEAIWPEFEKKWMAALQSYGVSAFHMADAMAHPKRGDFTTWSEEHVAACVQALLEVLLGIVMDFVGREFVIKACTVNLVGYQKAKAEIADLRSAPALCVDYCCGTALPDKYGRPGGEHSRVIFYFDHEEPFLHTIDRVWRKGRKSRSGWPTQIEQVLAVIAEKVPALQAADVLAWIVNGHYKGDTRARALFQSIKLFSLLSHAMYRYYDYEQILRQYGNHPSEPPQ
jgi:hypothetical protein